MKSNALRNRLLGNKIITCNYCGKMQCVVTPYALADEIVKYFKGIKQEENEMITLGKGIDCPPDPVSGPATPAAPLVTGESSGPVAGSQAEATRKREDEPAVGKIPLSQRPGRSW